MSLSTRMKYRRFGRTELEMPVLTCGGMRYQHKWNDVPEGEIPQDGQANLEATIHRAFELGINHIETARGYGTSEMQLGRVLPLLPREKMIIQTKVPPQPTQEEFLDTFDTSMRYLKLDHVDLLSIHGINNEECWQQTIGPKGSLAAARKLQKQGRCRFIGFSTHATCDLIVKAIESDEFDYVNLHWYFVNDLNWPAVEAATRHDMGVFIISPNDKGGKLYEPTPRLTELCQPLSPMIFNDLYCLRRPEVHTLSIGASRPSDFDEHLKALDFYDRIPETIDGVEARLREALDATHGHDWNKRWFEGLPEYFDMPGELNVVEICRLWTYATAFDMVEFGKMRYNLLGNAGHWFPGRNAGEFDEKAVRQAVDRSPFADRIPAILRESHALLADAPKQRLSQSD